MSEITSEDKAPEVVAEDAETAEPTEVTEIVEPEPVVAETETVAPEPAEDTTEVATAVTETPVLEPPAEPAAAPDPAPLVAPDPLTGPDPLTAPAPIIAPTPLPYPIPDLESPLSPPPPKKPRRKLPWRWVGAVVTMLAVGTGCAFAVMAPQRTELPGLKTASDGRYDFAPLVLPTLAPGQTDPGSLSNPGSQHISDIRTLLLVPPKGAVLDHSLPGGTGWVSKAATLALVGNSSSAADQLATDGWRHTAGVAWKTPDGAETKIWLVQFIDNTAATDASAAFDSFDGGAGPQDNSTNISIDGGNSAEYFRVVKGSMASWYGQVTTYDTEFLIEFTAPTSVGITPFEQEIDLQFEMLQ